MRRCFFFNDTATTEIYTLSLHDALPISYRHLRLRRAAFPMPLRRRPFRRSEEHTSELQSQSNLVCRLLLEKKKRAAPSVRHCRRRAPAAQRSVLVVRDVTAASRESPNND